MQQEESKIDLRRFRRAARQWRWLLIIGSALLIGLGCWVSYRALPKIAIKGEVLIGDNSSDQDSRAGSVSQMMRTFSVGGFSATAVNNEVLILSSHDVMLRVVRSLDLNRSYVGKTTDGDKVAFFKDSPVRVEAPAEHFDTLSIPFNIKITFKDKGKVDIKATKGFFKKTIAQANGVTLPAMFKTPLGSYQIIPADSIPEKNYKEVNVAICGNQQAAVVLNKKAIVSVPNKMADIIDVDYVAPNAQLGMATVNAIMGEYNAKRRERLHDASDASIKYYDERIAETFAALQKAETDVRNYQKNNELMGIDSELGILVGDAYGSRRDIRSSHYNIAYYETVLDILRNRLNDDVIIPSIETLGDPNVEAFNAAIQARRDLRRSATEDNEVLIRLNERIEELRNLIIENSTKQLAKYKKDLQHKESLAATAETRLENLPEYQQELLNLSRDKGHLSSLYSYLINQRENAVLQRYSTANIGFVFEPAYVTKDGSILRVLVLPAVCVVLSVFCCIFWILLMMWCSRKVKDPMDLAKIQIDEHAVKYTEKDGDSSVHRLRNMVTANPKHRVIYFSAMTDTEPMRQLFVDSLLSIGRSVEVISGFSSNDEILLPDTQQQIENALSTNDFVIIDVASPEKVFDLENVIDNENSILLISLKAGKISRKQLGNILKGQTADKVFAIIQAKK